MAMASSGSGLRGRGQIEGLGPRLRRTLVAVALVCGTALVPVLGIVGDTAPASALDCSAQPINYCATLETNASVAKVGTRILITLHSGLGGDQCFQLADN